MNVTQQIWNKFRVKHGEVPPFTGFLDSNRNHLAELFAECEFKIGAEIGVRTGVYSAAILSFNPKLKLYCIDPWSPYGRTSQDRQDQHFNRTQRRLEIYENVVYIKKTSMDALEDISDNSLDFVYIDGLHDFGNIMMDIINWSKKVKSGGIVSGHDYFYKYGHGVIYAVDAYVKAFNLTLYLTKELYPSWFWVKL